jgi:hypothetical protein
MTLSKLRGIPTTDSALLLPLRLCFSARKNFCIPAHQSTVAKTPGIVHSPCAMWTTAAEFEDIRYETTDEGQIAKITINRPEVRNAFRPKTVMELLQAF